MGETPGPIPNPEAKTHSADGTAFVRMWESRTPPDNTKRVEAPPHTWRGLPTFNPTTTRRPGPPHARSRGRQPARPDHGPSRWSLPRRDLPRRHPAPGRTHPRGGGAVGANGILQRVFDCPICHEWFTKAPAERGVARVIDVPVVERVEAWISTGSISGDKLNQRRQAQPATDMLIDCVNSNFKLTGGGMLVCPVAAGG